MGIYVNRIAAQNLKGKTFDFELGPRTLIIGDHDAGKSSVHEAVHALLFGKFPPPIPNRPVDILTMAEGGVGPILIEGSVFRDGEVIQGSYRIDGTTEKGNKPDPQPPHGIEALWIADEVAHLLSQRSDRMRIGLLRMAAARLKSGAVSKHLNRGAADIWQQTVKEIAADMRRRGDEFNKIDILEAGAKKIEADLRDMRAQMRSAKTRAEGYRDTIARGEQDEQIQADAGGIDALRERVQELRRAEADGRRRAATMSEAQRKARMREIVDQGRPLRDAAGDTPEEIYRAVVTACQGLIKLIKADPDKLVGIGVCLGAPEVQTLMRPAEEVIKALGDHLAANSRRAEQAARLASMRQELKRLKKARGEEGERVSVDEEEDIEALAERVRAAEDYLAAVNSVKGAEEKAAAFAHRVSQMEAVQGEVKAAVGRVLEDCLGVLSAEASALLAGRRWVEFDVSGAGARIKVRSGAKDATPIDLIACGTTLTDDAIWSLCRVQAAQAPQPLRILSIDEVSRYSRKRFRSTLNALGKIPVEDGQSITQILASAPEWMGKYPEGWKIIEL